MESKPQRFVFEFSIEAFPYNEEMVKAAFGGGYNIDFPIETFAIDKAYEILKDAFAHISLSQMKCMAEHGDPDKMDDHNRSYYEFLEEKMRHIKSAQSTLKFVRTEEVK